MKLSLIENKIIEDKQGRSWGLETKSLLAATDRGLHKQFLRLLNI